YRSDPFAPRNLKPLPMGFLLGSFSNSPALGPGTMGPEDALPLYFCFYSHFRMTSSQRLFHSWSSSVQLSSGSQTTIGFDSPYPLAIILFPVIPLLTKKALATSARFCDRSRLYSALPRTSVCVPISSTIPGWSFNSSTTCPKRSRASRRRYHRL